MHFIPWTAQDAGQQQAETSTEALFPDSWLLGSSDHTLAKDALEGHRAGYGECFYLYEEIAHLEFMLEALWFLGNMQEKDQMACLHLVFRGGRLGYQIVSCDLGPLLVPRNRLSQRGYSGPQQSCFSYWVLSWLP